MGTGSAIAHRAVDAVMGPRQVEHVQAEAAPSAPVCAPRHSTPQRAHPAQAAASACANQMKAFKDCLDGSNGDVRPARCLRFRVRALTRTRFRLPAASSTSTA